MDSLKPFLFGSLATLAIAGALFGHSAYAETQLNPKPQSTHLISLKSDSGSDVLSADLIDQVIAYDRENDRVEIHVYSVNDISGEPKEIVSTEVSKKEFTAFISEANKYRN